MSDGAFQGITPTRALKTILGGEPAPTKDEGQKKEEFCAWIRSEPGEIPSDSDNDGAYNEQCRVTANLVLRCLGAEPDAKDLDEYALYDRVKAYATTTNERECLDGLTGYMWGWAMNAARRCLDLHPVPNPALLTIEVKDE